MTARRQLVEQLPLPGLREGHKDEAPWDAVNKLLGGMRCIMWDGYKKQWDARAQHSNRYAHAATPVAAMVAAKALEAEELAARTPGHALLTAVEVPPPTPRRRVLL